MILTSDDWKKSGILLSVAYTGYAGMQYEKGREEVAEAEDVDLRTVEIEVRDYFEQLKSGRESSIKGKLEEAVFNPGEYFYNRGRADQLEESTDMDKIDDFYSELEDSDYRDLL